MVSSDKLVYFSQEDPRWKNVMYSIVNDPKQTIGTSGCGPTSFAMVASSILGKTILPTETAQFAIKKGYRTPDSGTAWMFFNDAAKHYGLECQQTGNFDVVKKALAGEALAIASMGPGHFTGGGHYIVLVGIRGDWVDVLDPNHKNTKYGNDGLIDKGKPDDGRVAAKESVIRKESKQFWIFPFPVKEENKEGDETLNLASWQKDMLVNALKDLYNQKIILDKSWIEKAEKGTLTVAELAWLNTIILARK